MMKRFVKWLQDAWYQEMYLSPLLVPFSLFFLDAVRFRRYMYKLGVKRSVRLPVPVIIVGNITVGGTGKTPLVIWLANFLKEQGYRPGIISRGYGGEKQVNPMTVKTDSTPDQVGDEPMLLARHADCPVVICHQRVKAGQYLLSHHDCNIVVADDGLQHYALQRDIEIAVIDGERRFGNGYLLPAGPLREPVERLQDVDLVVVNGIAEEDREFSMRITGLDAVNLSSGEVMPLAKFASQKCKAIAGIGNPKRFFNHLQQAGLTFDRLAFPDHHAFCAEDINFNDHAPVLMTEKDAVKCIDFATPLHWYVPVKAQPQPAFEHQLSTLLEHKINGYTTT